MELSAYLDRIGFEGTPRVDLDTLTRVHRGHSDMISYENLDVQAGTPLDIDVAKAFDKLVRRQRGGWCYEMNGVMGWALAEIGFTVQRITAGVLREVRGDSAIGNHLALLVDLDGVRYLADVGFGDGLVEPTPLVEGPIRQRFMTYRLEKLDDTWWRFHNHAEGGAASFDFTEAPSDDALLARQCERLQTWQESPFVQNAVCQRHFPDRIEILRGRVLKTVHAGGADKRLIADLPEYEALLADLFTLSHDQIPAIWDNAVKRHEELFGPAALAIDA